jgi:hypothetical protein
MTDRKFHEVPIIAGDALAGGFFDHGLRGTQPTQLKKARKGHPGAARALAENPLSTLERAAFASWR